MADCGKERKMTDWRGESRLATGRNTSEWKVIPTGVEQNEVIELA